MNSHSGCGNCEDGTFPCLNCAEYDYTGSLGPGYNFNKIRMLYWYTNPTPENEQYMRSAILWCRDNRSERVDIEFDHTNFDTDDLSFIDLDENDHVEISDDDSEERGFVEGTIAACGIDVKCNAIQSVLNNQPVKPEDAKSFFEGIVTKAGLQANSNLIQNMFKALH